MSSHNPIDGPLAEDPANTDTDLDTTVNGNHSSDSKIEGPTFIGPYRVLRLLGRGGMGSVFLAEQTEPVQRQVAVKIMRGFFLDPESKARFEAERQAMARLQHPNVAQIFAADATPEGHPYFVMELVEGESILDFCDEEQLTLEERLELFCQVCAGAQHAHQKGIIHRDLKPSNILVTKVEGRAVAKIIDFGIAKTLDEPLTANAVVTGDRLVGTPAYLSPEAATMGADRLDLDTRTDVYSLGILLYELLVGQRPFDDGGTGLLRVLQRIAVEEPTRPSLRWSGLDLKQREVLAARRLHDPKVLHRSLRGDLDAIVLKAIAKDRDQRYGSTAELAADIRRFLNHQPVQAGTPSPWYVAKKLVRRRRGAVAATTLIAVALVGGFVARTMEAERANREAAAAVAARLETEAALQHAERSKREADEVSSFLLELFSVSDPGKARGSSVTARELLDAAAQRIDGELAEQPVTKARLLHTMADVYRKLGLFERAEPLYDRSLELRRAHLPAEHDDIAQSLAGKGSLLATVGKTEAALPFFEEALRLRRRSTTEKPIRIAVALGNLGALYADLGRLEEAESSLHQAAEIAAAYDGPPEEGVAPIFNNLGSLFEDQGRHAEAELQFRLFIERQTALSGGEDHPWVAFGLENLAGSRFKQGDGDGALTLYGRALSLLTRLFGEDHPEVGFCLMKMAEVELEDPDQAGRAAEHLREAQRTFAALPPGHPYLEEAEALRARLP